MADFINTIDALGDDAVIDSIINRTITEFKDNSLTYIGTSAFNGCEALKTVDLPYVTELRGSGMNGYQFAGCKALETVNMPLLTAIHCRGGFTHCSNLKSINFPLLDTITPGGNGGYVFEYTGLVEVVFPKLKEVCGGMFQGCSDLEKIDLHVVTFMSDSFAYDKKLKTIIIRTPSVCALGGNWGFSTTPIGSGGAYIYVPRSLVDSYKAATNWSSFATQFRALEDYTVDGTVTGELDETKI